ncbi:ATP-binding protein [Dactylosporangium sp. AC04546]|uniref:ATP-binding protein n=1 Tax=Dactylosporangium sp. AC04546 TaxID=2862460 RepID=UPI001EE0D1A7|nr:ATP-binding protein [Dactylosporangium sp. AC04546]WVK87777.1 ATP-binding protein [Dactylosporangium sp. AC04546]
MDETLADESHILTMPPVTVDGVAGVRQSVGAAAHRAGLPQERADLFTVAVNEIVINAIEHGGGVADVTIIVAGPRLTVEVGDRGTAGPPLVVPGEPPPVDQPGGRGLWLASRLCDELTIEPRGHPGGTVVRLTTVVQLAG